VLWHFCCSCICRFLGSLGERGLSFSLHLFKNCPAYEAGERPHQTPIDAELPQRIPETLDPCLRGKSRTLRRLCPQFEIPCGLCTAGRRKPDKIVRREFQASPALSPFRPSTCDLSSRSLGCRK
jgi:hypothetical protein